MSLQPVGIHFGPHIPRDDLAILDIINRVYQGKPGVALVMEGSTWIAEAMPKGSLVVQRLHYLFENVNLSNLTEAQCYSLGEFLARQAISVSYPSITHFMGICEPQLDTVEDGLKLGVFDAGLADTFLSGGYGFCGLNSCMGKPESAASPSEKPVIEAYAISFAGWSEGVLGIREEVLRNPRELRNWLSSVSSVDIQSKVGGLPALIWGYHMYQSPPINDRFLGQRPWVYWEQCLKKVGLGMPPILGTEAGIDAEGVGGYRKFFHNDASSRYAEVIKLWPKVFPKAIGGCFFGVMMGEDQDGITWHDKGFDYEDDDKVLAAMAEANARHTEEEPEVKSNFDKRMDELISRALERRSKAPAFYKLWLQYQGELGEIIGGEFDVKDERDGSTYRFQECEFGYIWAKVGDWANCRIAFTRSKMPPF